MKPEANEYAPYYGKYVELVPAGDIAVTLQAQGEQTLTLLHTLSEAQGGHAYAPGKWTIKELIGHVNDTERIFAYRLLRIGRNDQTPLAGFEQDDYVASTDFNARTLASLLDEFAAVRQATLQLCQPFTEAEWLRRGTASEHEITARALAHIIAGHELYHVDILKTRYLAAAA
ncbi:MAG: DinB family protein [Acidobacteria bacterium]|nr:DinB family protein [Acidobacteriota bacterium]MBI3425736.1 DinB family protein [Acidobacteriota bacterium]